MSKTPEEVGEELGVEKEEFSALLKAIKRMSKCGIRGGEAGKQMRSVLSQLNTPAKFNIISSRIMAEWTFYHRLLAEAKICGLKQIDGETPAELEARINKYRRGDYE